MIPDLKGYLAEAQRLRSELAAIEGIKVLKTDTNFMHEARHVCDGDNHPEQNKVRWSVRNSLFFLSFDSIFVHN